MFLRYLFIFCRVITALKEEEELQKARVRPYEIDNTRGLGEKRNKKYERTDEAIETLITTYYNDQNRNDQTLIHLLHALQYRLTDKGIDHLD
jgi:hypothetical protein